jgi:hypothetical protein
MFPNKKILFLTMIQLLVLGETTLHSQSDVVITFMYFDSQKKHIDACLWLGHKV